MPKSLPSDFLRSQMMMHNNNDAIEVNDVDDADQSDEELADQFE